MKIIIIFMLVVVMFIVLLGGTIFAQVRSSAVESGFLSPVHCGFSLSDTLIEGYTAKSIDECHEICEGVVYQRGYRVFSNPVNVSARLSYDNITWIDCCCYTCVGSHTDAKIVPVLEGVNN